MYTGDIIRVTIFMVFFAGVSVFNIIMVLSFLKQVTGPSYSGDARGERKKPFLRRVLIWIFLITFPAEILCLVWGLFIEPHMPEATFHTIVTDRLANGSELHIAHISDLHFSPDHDNTDFLLKKLRTNAPDMILITGDYVNYKEDYDAMMELLHRIEKIAPLYLITGNVDCNWMEKVEKLKSEFNVLYSGVETVELDSSVVHLVGADDCLPDTISLSVEELQDRPPGYTIVLYHKPDCAKEPWIDNFDLYLCGHTHGGQVRLPLYGAVITFSRYGKEFEMGRYSIGENTVMYVNRGYGVEGGAWYVPGVRFLCRPEIAFFTIKGKEA